MKKKLIITLTIITLSTAGILGYKAINKHKNNSVNTESTIYQSSAPSLHELKIKDAITLEDIKTTIKLKQDNITTDGDTSGVSI